MGLYELSIDPTLVAEAETLVSQSALERRAFPTLVVQWDTKLFDQAWQTTLVLDYLVALPPLEPGRSFIPVRVAAFVGNAASKYFYFGTEMNDTVPRLAPEMENTIAPAGLFQEFLIDERTTPIPYLKLISATPRVYGNGPQDYYAPPIKVERFDAGVTQEHIADLFAEQVANLAVVPGNFLTEPSKGAWEGSRYSGIRTMAILRQGKVVGLHRKQGRGDKETAPSNVIRRDPKLDILASWVAVDVGVRSITVAIRGERSSGELVRIGTNEPLKRASDNESPAEVSFVQVKPSLKAWRDRVIQPHLRWEELRVGFGSSALRLRGDTRDSALLEWPEPFNRAASTIFELPLVRDYTDEKRDYRLVGQLDKDSGESLKKPAPPVIDEEGVGAHDPFDPIELYAYHIGLTVNHRLKGIHTKYLVTMPTGLSADRRRSILVAFRRGFFRSLPAGMIDYHDLEGLVVEDAGPTTVGFLAHAHRAFSALPKDGPVLCAVLDMGASETGILFGLVREPSPEEKRDGHTLVIEHLEPQSLGWFGGERLLHRLSYQVYTDHATEMIEAQVPFDLPRDAEVLPGADDLLAPSPESRANTYLLKELLRPLFEGDPTYRLPTTARLGNRSGAPQDIRLSLNRAGLKQRIEQWFQEALAEFKGHLQGALVKLSRASDPYEGLRVFLGGRMSMNAMLQDVFQKGLPSNVRVHKFREPDRTNLNAPTVKTATVLGTLAVKIERIGVTDRAEKRDAFRFRVGKGRHGQLNDVLDPSVDYDTWREMGPCVKPSIDLLFMRADDDGEVAADDPRVMRVECDLGMDSVGKRVFLRAVGPNRVELGTGAPGIDADEAEGRLAVDLSTGMTFTI